MTDRDVEPSAEWDQNNSVLITATRMSCIILLLYACQTAWKNSQSAINTQTHTRAERIGSRCRERGRMWTVRREKPHCFNLAASKLEQCTLVSSFRFTCYTKTFINQISIFFVHPMMLCMKFLCKLCKQWIEVLFLKGTIRWHYFLHSSNIKSATY